MTAANFVIGVGSGPARPANIPFDEKNIFTSDEVLKLGSLPRSLIVVGGGVIGPEYASMLAAPVVRATLIEGRPQDVTRNPDGRYRLFRIGDAVSSRNVHAAIYNALRLCKDL